jgi:hypothetical protein
MRIPHFATRALTAAAVTVVLVGCSQDSGPSEFNPDGTSADVTAAQSAFGSPAAASFSAVGADISMALGGAPAVAGTTALSLARPGANSALYASELVRLLPRQSTGIQASFSAVPSGVLGTTFVWDDSAQVYVASDITGAPSSGVRFLLYAIDPVTLRPVAPLVEVGYVDLVDQSTATSVSFQVKVVDGNVIYLDYTVAATSSASGGVISIKGYAWNGEVRANFDLKNTVNQSATGVVVSLEYNLTVPARNLTVSWTATFANISSTEVAVTVDLGINGTNGNVRIVGTYGAAGGTFTVKVNGETFATITLEGSSFVITGANGQALTPAEEATLQTILDYYDHSLSGFAGLLAPLS